MTLSPYPSTSEERTMASVAHVAATVAWLVSAGWLTFLGPLILWLIYRDRSLFVRRAAAGAFNFALTMTVVGIVGWVMVFTLLLLPLGILLITVSGLGRGDLGHRGRDPDLERAVFLVPRSDSRAELTAFEKGTELGSIPFFLRAKSAG